MQDQDLNKTKLFNEMLNNPVEKAADYTGFLSANGEELGTYIIFAFMVFLLILIFISIAVIAYRFVKR